MTIDQDTTQTIVANDTDNDGSDVTEQNDERIAERPAHPVLRNGRRVEFKGQPIEVPEDLWDKENGKIRDVAAVKRVLDLRRKLSEKPPVPDSYELTVPEGLDIDADAEDPLAQSAMDWAKKHGLSQEAFGELTSLFYQQEADFAKSLDEQQEQDYNTLKEIYGDGTKKKLGELARWVDGVVGDATDDNPMISQALDTLVSDAGGVLLLDRIRSQVGESPIPSPIDQRQHGITPESLRELQHSPAYLDNSHPDHAAVVAQVRRGYQRLYPDK
ncbi:MAG: hypothetical protein AAF442_08120 [Pseudomonadota bacterium]